MSSELCCDAPPVRCGVEARGLGWEHAARSRLQSSFVPKRSNFILVGAAGDNALGKQGTGEENKGWPGAGMKRRGDGEEGGYAGPEVSAAVLPSINLERRLVDHSHWWTGEPSPGPGHYH